MSTEYDDRELFEGAMADAPAAQAEPEQQPQAQAIDEGQVRDERGRFAAAEPQAEAPQEEQANQTEPDAQPAEGKAQGQVPAFRLREEAEARRKVEAELAELRQTVATLSQRQQPPQAPHQPQQAQPEGDLVDALLTDPAAFLAQRDAQNMQAVGVTLVDMQPGGREARGAAYQALTQLQTTNPHAFQAATATIFSAPPLQQAQAMVEWHKQYQTQQRVGSDPEAFFTRTLEERLTSDPAFAASLVEKLTGQARQAQPAPTGKPAIALPPSLSRATSAAPAVGSLGDTSDAAIFNDALR